MVVATKRMKNCCVSTFWVPEFLFSLRDIMLCFLCVCVCMWWVEFGWGEVGWMVEGMREAFRRVRLNDVSWPIRCEPLTISHAVAAFPSNPSIPYPISSWFCSHICPPPPAPHPCTSQHSSPYTILRVRKKKEIGLHEGVEAIIHFSAIVFPQLRRPMFPM
jgi:hypothetical protein